MKSSTTRAFRKRLAALPPDIQAQARKQFRLWVEDPWHPSLHFKRVGEFWSARVDRSHRALAVEADGHFIWFYIGGHDGYEARI